MNILVVAGGYPTKKYLGNGIFEFDQAKALAYEGHNVYYAAVDLRSIRRWRKWGIEKFNKNGVNIYNYSLPLGRLPVWLMDSVGKKCLSRIYLDIARKIKVDIIHAHFSDMGAIAGQLSLETGIPLIITEHSSAFNIENWNLSLKKRALQVYNQADQIIAVSNILARRIKENVGISAICVPNIVDTDIFYYKEKKSSFQEFTFISVGNLLYNKGFDLLIKAFATLTEKYKCCTLKIYGQGEEKENLEKLINEYQLNEKVTLCGMKERITIAEDFHNADAFVLASRGETFGVAYIEAMSAGLPIIATKCGGPEDFMTEEIGCIIPVDDVASLERSMELMIENRSIYNRKMISDYANSKFSPHSVCDKLKIIYLDVISHRNKE